jgi:hypothetical protein
MGFYDGIEDAEVSNRLPWLQPGSYVLQVDALKQIPKSRKGPLFIAEYTIVKRLSNEGNPEGTRCSHVIKMSLDTALQNIKGLVSAILDENPKSVTRAVCESLSSDKNPAKGGQVRADTSIVKTKTGGDFTLHNYTHVELPPQFSKAKKSA